MEAIRVSSSSGYFICNSVPFFDLVAAYSVGCVWSCAYSMTVNKIGLLDLSEVNRMCMEEHNSLSIPYGYRMDNLLIVWWSTLV